MKNIAIFASGNGSNAENIIKYFQEKKTAQVNGVYTNKPTAYVLERARNCGVPASVFNRTELNDGTLLSLLEHDDIDYIVLAGFLWLMPPDLIRKFDGRIVNIHPALLPKYGGKGMYGDRVHQAVIDNGETKSGITIHLVNEEYDNGEILFQAEVEVTPQDSPSTLATKIHELEYRHFPEVIERLIVE